MGLSTLLTHQLSSLYKLKIENDEDGDESNPATLTVEVPYVQQQKGYTDCGLFAIAFAVHLALEDEVTTLNFEQSLMQQHLLKCSDKKAVVAFPLKMKTAGISRPHRLRLRVIELHCTCMMQDTIDDMIECDTCEMFYHLKCVGLGTASSPWQCSKCNN